MRGRDLMFAVGGVLILLAFKYVFFGLRNWNSVLHPTRTEPSNSIFLSPFFDVFGKGTCGNCS